MVTPDGLDFLRPDVRVFGAEMQHHRTARALCRRLRDPATVIAHCSRRIKTRGRKPGETSTKAVAHHAHFSRLLSGIADRGSHVLERGFHADLRGRAHAFLHSRRVIAKLKARLGTIENRRRNGKKSLLGEIVGYGSNMRVDSEDFLYHNKRTLYFLIARAIGLEVVAIGRGKLNVRSHAFKNIPSALVERSSLAFSV